jgi:hypothetical protein
VFTLEIQFQIFYLLIGIDRNMEPEFKVKIPVPCEVKIPGPWGHVSGKFSIINMLPTDARQVSSVVGQFVYSWVFSSSLSCGISCLSGCHRSTLIAISFSSPYIILPSDIPCH